MPKNTHPTTTDQAQLHLSHLPERVTVAVAELASAAREGLLALAVGTGLQVLEAMLVEDVAGLVGAKGRHLPERTAVRHGSEPGQVTLGGRRVRVRRPRVRTADGTRELPVPTYQAFAATDLLDQLAVERMLAKLSTRRYQAGLEPVGRDIERAAAGTPSRQLIESVNQTFKGQLDLERHGGRTGPAANPHLTAAIWHNDKTGQMTLRSLVAYDH